MGSQLNPRRFQDKAQIAPITTADSSHVQEKLRTFSVTPNLLVIIGNGEISRTARLSVGRTKGGRMRPEEALAIVCFESLGASRKLCFKSGQSNREIDFDVVDLSGH